MKNQELKLIALAAIGGLAIALSAYVGITNSLCSRIDTFTAQEQSEMKLDAKACAKPWYAKL